MEKIIEKRIAALEKNLVKARSLNEAAHFPVLVSNLEAQIAILISVLRESREAEAQCYIDDILHNYETGMISTIQKDHAITEVKIKYKLI